LGISATILASVSFANSRRNSPRIFGGATITIWSNALVRAALLIRSAIEAAKRSFSSSCQSVSSTALRIPPPQHLIDVTKKGTKGRWHNIRSSPEGVHEKAGPGCSSAARRRRLGNFSFTLVDQKQGLLTVAYENPGAMRKLMMRHRDSPWFLLTPRCRDASWLPRWSFPVPPRHGPRRHRSVEIRMAQRRARRRRLRPPRSRSYLIAQRGLALPMSLFWLGTGRTARHPRRRNDWGRIRAAERVQVSQFPGPHQAKA
jgi:hypothetical protein